MDFAEVPIGFGMALAQNEEAVNAYAMMTKEQKNAVLKKAHNARSETEMNQIVRDIIENRMQYSTRLSPPGLRWAVSASQGGTCNLLTNHVRK